MCSDPYGESVTERKRRTNRNVDVHGVVKMLTEEYVRNLKPQKENKKIEMSVARAKVIAAVLTKNDFENSFSYLDKEFW